ncbi:MAG: 5-(carboxyamino)imidazole ribonucleotide mutase [Candidatus Omnitrophica bacterium]|nr:5-(carboxyamino)imidazole ribonucleotide mutase [Candidatus Omnitrophota bacterium]
MARRPVVGIVMGSDSDWPVMQESAGILKAFGVPHEVRVLSAHRSPKLVSQYATAAVGRGLRVIIAAAGGAAHLGGVVAAHTTLPVIGVPLEGSSLQGLDALLATVQMPGGIPVASMAVGKAGAKNAGLFAVQLLAQGRGPLQRRLLAYKRRLHVGVRQKDQALRRQFGL